jgi:hypothetical protein
MSNLWFNVRFGYYHWQCGPDKFFTWSRNQYQQELRENLPDWKWIEIYTIFGVHL